MRCLSVKQPWASLILLGAKQYETRGWHSDYRGRIAIHAGRSFPESARRLFETEPFHAALLAGGFKHPSDLSCQAILGTVELLGCRLTEEVRPGLLPADVEIQLGDFRPGRWAWQLARPILLARPIPYPGRLGLFEVPDLETFPRS